MWKIRAAPRAPSDEGLAPTAEPFRAQSSTGTQSIARPALREDATTIPKVGRKDQEIAAHEQRRAKLDEEHAEAASQEPAAPKAHKSAVLREIWATRGGCGARGIGAGGP